MRRWFKFDQNNSGGSFDDPGDIFVEAEDEEEALDLANEHYDVYYRGVAEGIDCSCCGDRWYSPHLVLNDFLASHGLCHGFAVITKKSVVEFKTPESLRGMFSYREKNTDFFHSKGDWLRIVTRQSKSNNWDPHLFFFYSSSNNG